MLTNTIYCRTKHLSPSRCKQNSWSTSLEDSINMKTLIIQLLVRRNSLMTSISRRSLKVLTDICAARMLVPMLLQYYFQRRIIALYFIFVLLQLWPDLVVVPDFHLLAALPIELQLLRNRVFVFTSLSYFHAFLCPFSMVIFLSSALCQ